jgi:hypothetical protein
MVTALVFTGFVLLRVALLVAIAWLLIPRDRGCPACGAVTVPLRRAGLVRLAPGIERRWCLECGWSWFRKRARTVPAQPPAARPARRNASDSPAR